MFPFIGGRRWVERFYRFIVASSFPLPATWDCSSAFPIQYYPDNELRKKTGLVLQDSFRFTGNIAHNIRLINDGISDEDIRRAAQFVQADEFIENLPEGCSQEIGERGAAFSSAQRQLISFARTHGLLTEDFDWMKRL